MDDGAADVAVAVAMLTDTGHQGVSTVVATPHFYPGDVTVENFLHRRQQAMNALTAALPADAPRVLPGAEVLMRQGVSKQDLRSLCLPGTEYLLVELPLLPMPHWLVEELEDIAFGQQLNLVLAHADRYMPWYSREQMATVVDFPDMIIQLNGEVFLHRGLFSRLRRWLPEPQGLLIGSDMHNTDKRPPNMGLAAKAMARHKVGRQWLTLAEKTAADLFGDAE